MRPFHRPPKRQQMTNNLVFTDQEIAVDESLGYPKAYAKLCRDRSFGPFSHGPPFTFTPYSLVQLEELLKFIMDPEPDVHVSENGESEARNGSISGKIEAFNCFAGGNNFADVILAKNGHFGDVPASRITVLMKLGNLESASTHSLFGVVNRILEESIQKKNGDVTMRVASLLKLVIQEIEQRVSKQVNNMKKQSNLYKSREDRYHTKIRALETLATGTGEEIEVVMNHLQQVKVNFLLKMLNL
ncbi:hypothetical protein CASFOL_004772 [Castilleja foliolosa]|uniref:Uncharacterized protein n=1 Tax=Castilleja foliolosa TaxID=1961234 RepID=A0ABD3EBH3_9LAMI